MYLARPLATPQAMRLYTNVFAPAAERWLKNPYAWKADGLPHCKTRANPMLLGWNTFLGVIRTQSDLSPDIREICMVRPALLNKAWFEWEHHMPLLRAAPGITLDHFAIIEQPIPVSQGPLNSRQWAALRYCDAVTTNVRIPDYLFQELRRNFEEKEVVEITITCAAYNMVGRFLVALDVGEMNS